MFVSTSLTCLHKRALFQRLSGSKMGRGQCLTALAPRQDFQLHVGLLWICLAEENFLTQVKRETFHHSPRQTKQFSSSCAQVHVPVQSRQQA